MVVDRNAKKAASFRTRRLLTSFRFGGVRKSVRRAGLWSGRKRLASSDCSFGSLTTTWTGDFILARSGSNLSRLKSRRFRHWFSLHGLANETLGTYDGVV